MEHAGRFLRSIRESAGLTQQEIGERLGKPQSEVSEIEQRPNMLLSSFRRYVKAAGAKPVVAAPIIGANTPEQLADLLPATELQQLSADELETLNAASQGM